MRRTGLLLGLLLATATAALSAQVQPRKFLFKDSRAELAQALARGEADILLVMAAMPGRVAGLARAVEAAGGTVQFRDDDVDYLRARVPLDGVAAITGHSDLHSVDVSLGEGRPRTFGRASDEGPERPADMLRPTGTHSPGEGPERPADILRSTGTHSPSEGPERSADMLRPTGTHSPSEGPERPADTLRPPGAPQLAPDTIWPPRLSDLPLTRRYHPWADTRALSFLEANPTYDGRGVTIAMIDMNPDMLLPELQVAKAMDGSDIPKIAVYGTALDVREEDDGRWLHMDDVVVAVGGTFEHDDSTWRAPRDGTFRMALFDESEDQGQGNALEGDVNRDGNPEGSSRLFGVLWDEESGDVWVDTDQDRDFTDEPALSDFGTRPRFGVFGTDDPDTPVRESVGFGVQTDAERDLVALNLGVASHASLVVGAAVGSRGTEGRFDGMAPGAQLISISEGGAAYGQTESTILSAQAGADVIYFEQSSNITRTYLPRDGRLVPSVIGERLVERYGPSILSPTHNYPIVGAIDDIVMGRGVIGVNGHESKENFFRNHGVRVEHDDNLLITGGYGPMGNGALKPDIISPSNYVSTAQGFVEGRSIAGLFELPPGYTIAGGTSTATPTAAGAVALLLSGARQAGLPDDPYTIKWAVTRGARWVPHIAAYKQGNGVISVEGAWAMLNALAAGGTRVDITSRASVRHPYSHLLPTPHEGVGLYERSGWDRGDRDVRTITLTRTTGPRDPMTFEVAWDGNDHGTFSSPRTVTLPRDTPVGLPVTVAPGEYGVHTAHLTLTHPDVTGYAHRTLATVIAPRPLTSAEGFRQEVEVEVPRPGITSRFFRVPEGTQTLLVDLGWEDREVSLAVSAPDTRQVRGRQIERGSGVTHVVSDPMPGVWEIRMTDVEDTRTFDWQQAKKEEPVPPTPATLTVSALAVEVEALETGAVVAEGGDGGAAARAEGVPPAVRLTNRMADFEGGATSTAAGSSRVVSGELAHRAQRVFEIEVLPGSEALVAAVSAPSDGDADLDLYVFDCTDEEDGCQAARADGDPVGGERIHVASPGAGTWKVVVDAFDVPAGTVAFEYEDVVLNPAYGTVATSDLPQERKSGDRWVAHVGRWLPPSAHASGRAPWYGLVVQAEAGGETFPVALRALAR